MNHTHSIEQTLVERIERLEKTNRSLVRGGRFTKGALGLACVGFCMLLVLGGASPKMNDLNCKTVTAEQVVLVDAQGHKLITLGANKEGTGMTVYTPEGKKSLMLGLGDEGKNSGLAILDAQENARIGLGMEGAVPSMVVCDEQGKKIIALGAGKERYGIAVLDHDEVARVGLGMGPKGPLCALMDESGAPRAGMAQNANGAFQISVIDKDGQERVMD